MPIADRGVRSANKKYKICCAAVKCRPVKINHHESKDIKISADHFLLTANKM